jgi:cell division protein FtsN
MRNDWHHLRTVTSLIGCATLLCATLGAASAQDAAPAPAQKAASAKAKKPKAAPGAAAESAAPAAVKDPAAALAAYNAGVTAYQAGKFDPAIQSFNGAIQGGGLPSGTLAKALYYRGAAFQQQGKPGQAISDLTSALWLKGGLDETERAAASKFRSAAYRDAGLADDGQVANAGRINEAAVAARVTETSSLGVSTGSVASTTSVAAPQLNAVPNEQAASAPSTGLGGLGNLFGGLFNGVKPSAPAPALTVQAAAETETLPWTNRPVAESPSATDAPPPAATPAAKKPTAPKSVAPKAAAKPPVKPTAPAKAPGVGAYRIQVANVKSRDEASAVISKLQALGGPVASTPSTVEETTFGTSTYYRVKLGPFANAAATKAPCSALKAGGLDCLVTAN